jgi:hypothetical protein
MNESDIEHQKRSKVGRRGTEGRPNATKDATPDIQSPGMIKEIGKEEAGKKRGGSSRGSKSRKR